MNCAECQENLAAYLEELLDRQTAADCRQHLQRCPACQTVHKATFSLREQLLSRGQMAAQVSLVEAVWKRVLQEQPKPARKTIMSTLLKHRWGWGLGVTASAAAIIAIAIIAPSVLNMSAPKAFGIDQVIAAYKNVHFVHVKTFMGAEGEPASEFWIQSDDQGQVEKARYHLPHTEDGEKLITWTPERSEIWCKNKGRFWTFQTKKIAPWMQQMLEQSQPQLVLKAMQADQKEGKVNVDIQTPPGKQDPEVIVVSYKDAPQKAIYRIDPKTNLISRIEHYRIDGAKEVLGSHTEYCDYNVAIDPKMFSIRGELPKDVRIADSLNQLIGVPQEKMTDEQAAAETVRQFFQALLDKDYKKAGLIVGGELEDSAKEEYGGVTVAKIVSIGPPVAKADWVKHGFVVPCELEIVDSQGKKTTLKPGVYVRPGDDEMHPDRWNISGGFSVMQFAVQNLPDQAKYENMTPRQAAEAFFKACADKQWDEVLKFMPKAATTGDRFDRLKEYLGGLEIVSIGEAYQTKEYSGWFVPYEIKLPAQEINVRVSKPNQAKRCVVTGIYDRKMQLTQDLKWSTEPEVLANNDAYAKLTPAQAVKAYCDAQAKFDWVEMGKFTTEADVEQTKKEVEEMKKAGKDTTNLMPVVEVGEATWSAQQSVWFVKCRVPHPVKKFNLAIRNDNTARRWMFDGGI